MNKIRKKFKSIGGRVPVHFRWHKNGSEVNTIAYVDLHELVRNGIASTLNKVQQRINAPNESYRHIYMEDELVSGVLNSTQRIPVTYRNMKKV